MNKGGIILREGFMNYMKVFTKTMCFLIVLGVCGFSCLDHPAAASTESIDFDGLEPVELNSVISEINRQEAYLIVGEKKVFLIEFKVGGKNYMTAFINERGGTSYINSLRTILWKGQRVLVRGFKLNNGDILAGIIKMIPADGK
jgi:hypothetical protein